MKKEKFIKEVIILPAFDRRNPDPTKNYGIHGCDMRFVLKGKKGAVQFVLFTNWQLPHVTEESVTRTLKNQNNLDKYDIKCHFLPSPADLGYHSLKPMYTDQSRRESCEYLDGKPCYYDGSGLDAEPVYEILLREGSDGVWKKLEDYYNATFK